VHTRHGKEEEKEQQGCRGDETREGQATDTGGEEWSAEERNDACLDGRGKGDDDGEEARRGQRQRQQSHGRGRGLLLAAAALGFSALCPCGSGQVAACTSGRA
jgi:hypothetical protein